MSHTGWPLAGPASTDRDELLVAEVNLSDARRKHSLNHFNHLLRDRRPEVYGAILRGSQ